MAGRAEEAGMVPPGVVPDPTCRSGVLVRGTDTPGSESYPRGGQ